MDFIIENDEWFLEKYILDLEYDEVSFGLFLEFYGIR